MQNFAAVVNGEFDQAAAEGANSISEIGNSALTSKLGVDELGGSLDDIVEGSPYDAEVNVAKINEGLSAARELHNILQAIGGELPDGGASASGGNSNNNSNGTPYTPGTSPTGGNQGPGFASGGSFTVPAGFPNDSYPMRVSSGEHITVTPAGKMSSGGGNVINVAVYVSGAAAGNPYLMGDTVAGQVANKLGVRG
jgi:hypothetical protein